MLIKKLIMEDWRQFKGSQEISFSTSEDKPVTLIHAENDGGKSSILNAFCWALHEKLTDSFKNPYELIHRKKWHEAKAGKEVNASVTLIYNHDKIDYTLKKEITIKKNSGNARQEPNNPNLSVINTSLEYTEDDGFTQKITDDEKIKSQIYKKVPLYFRKFLFFDGEEFSHQGRRDDKDLSKIIHEKLDLEAYARGIRHIRDAEKIFHDRIKPDVNIEELRNDWKKLEKELGSVDDESGLRYIQYIAKSNITSLKDTIKETEDQLKDKGDEEVKRLAAEKEELNIAIRTLDSKIKKAAAEVDNIIRTEGYLVFLENLTSKIEPYFENAAKKKEAWIPSKFKQSFIDDIIESKKCICGIDINAEMEQYLSSWREKGGTDLTDTVFNFMKMSFPSFSKTTSDKIRSKLKSLNGEIDNNADEMEEKKATILDIEKKIGNISVEEIKALQNKITKLRKDQGEEEEAYESLTGKVAVIENKEADARIKYITEVEKTKKNDINSKCELVCLDLANRLETLHEEQLLNVRSDIEKTINDYFKNSAISDGKIKLSDDFKPTLVDQNGVDTGFGQGVQQILTIAYISGIISVLKERSKKTQNSEHKNIQYPLVLDSIYGVMDITHSRNTSKQISTAADQAIVLVSSSQYNKGVEEGYEKRIGKQYYLEYYSEACDEDAEKHQYSSKQVQFRKKTTGIEYTLVKEL